MSDSLSPWVPQDSCGFLFAADEVPISRVRCLSRTDSETLESFLLGLPHLSDGDLLDHAAALPTISDEDISALSDPECESLLRVYSFALAHFLRRSLLEPDGSLPRAVGRHLWKLAERAGRPPSLTYATYVLSNHTSLIGHRTVPECFGTIASPSGTPDEDWFIAVHGAVESIGGQVLWAADQMDQGLRQNDVSQVAAGLSTVATELEWARSSFLRVQERLDLNVFTSQIRPLLHGHDAVRFAGIVGEPRVSILGETGAQSGVIRALDLLLGLRHPPHIERSMALFSSAAPPQHRRAFVRIGALGVTLRERVHAEAGIAKEYRNVVGALTAFRSSHLEVVERYLPAAPDAGDRGTGGTQFRRWLRQLVTDTDVALRNA